jgi:alpha-glucosidase
MWARGGVTRDGARVPLPWTEDPALTHGFSLREPAACPWLPVPAGWSSHAIDRQQEDPDSVLRLATQSIALRRRLWDEGLFTADDGGIWQVEEGNLLLCERSRGFLVAIAMGTEAVKLPAGVVLFSAFPLEEDGWLQPDNAVWLRRN